MSFFFFLDKINIFFQDKIHHIWKGNLKTVVFIKMQLFTKNKLSLIQVNWRETWI